MTTTTLGGMVLIITMLVMTITIPVDGRGVARTDSDHDGRSADVETDGDNSVRCTELDEREEDVECSDVEEDGRVTPRPIKTTSQLFYGVFSQNLRNTRVAKQHVLAMTKWRINEALGAMMGEYDVGPVINRHGVIVTVVFNATGDAVHDRFICSALNTLGDRDIASALGLSLSDDIQVTLASEGSRCSPGNPYPMAVDMYMSHVLWRVPPHIS
jgi:hypothetical protein